MGRSILDNIIATISPETGLKREAARTQLEQVRKYEGAGKGRRTRNWRAPSSDANTELDGSLQRLRDRSRDLVRNNPYATNALRAIMNNTIGAGIRGEPNSRRAPQKAQRLETLWQRWAETTECDADGKRTLYGLEALAVETMVQSGGVIIRKRRRRLNDNRTIPMQLQIMEPDMIDIAKDDTSGGNQIIQGVEFNSIGQVVAYWMHESHPGDRRNPMSMHSKRVPADDIIYMHRTERPGQVHGVPWLAPVMIRLRDLDSFEDAQLVRQKVAAMFTTFIYDATGTVGATAMDNNNDGQYELGEKLEPGAIELLPPGKDIKHSSPPGVSSYDEFTRNQLRAIAAGVGVPYETLVYDYSNVNFSSGRMGWLEFHRNLNDWQQNIVIPQMLNPIWDWFREAVQISTSINPSDVAMKWITPRREMIDPTKEVPANRDRVRSGQTSWRRLIREQGLNPDEIAEEIAADNARFDELGIVTDADPRRITGAGSFQKEEGVNDAENE